GRVMNRPSSVGCPSPGQHLIIGNMLRSELSFSTTSWHGALLTVLGRYFENSRSFGSIANFSNRVLGGDWLSISSIRTATSSSLFTSSARHIRSKEPKRLVTTGYSEPFTFSK